MSSVLSYIGNIIAMFLKSIFYNKSKYTKISWPIISFSLLFKILLIRSIEFAKRFNILEYFSICLKTLGPTFFKAFVYFLLIFIFLILLFLTISLIVAFFQFPALETFKVVIFFFLEILSFRVYLRFSYFLFSLALFPP